MWKIIARMRGFQEAFDYDMYTLIVWHSQWRVHYSGPSAWKHAALHRWLSY